MVMRWTAAAMQEAAMKAFKQLPVLAAALKAHHAKPVQLEAKSEAA